MTPSDLRAHAAALIVAVEPLTDLAACRRALANIADARAGIRAARTDGGNGATRARGEVPDPTADAAGKPDPAEHARRELERIADIVQRARAVGDTFRVWTTTPDTAGVADVLDDPQLWCAHHLHATSQCEPATYSTHPGTGDRMRLCRWCYDRAKTTGRLPAAADLHRHARGQRVRGIATPGGKPAPTRGKRR